MENLPIFISVVFVFAFVVCMLFFHYANSRSIKVTGAILVLSIAQSYLALQGFYENTTTSPPRFLLVFFPSACFVIYGLLPRQMKWIRKVRKLEFSTLLHVVRIPIEMVLYNLFLHDFVPELMTFEGRNYDILVGMTAPIIAFLHFKKWIGTKVLLLWNFIGLALVLFIFVNAVLSLEVPFQQFAFDQPNVAVKYFPFVLLPVVIVPIVIWAHVSDIFYLSKEKQSYVRGFKPYVNEQK